MDGEKTVEEQLALACYGSNFFNHGECESWVVRSLVGARKSPNGRSTAAILERRETRVLDAISVCGETETWPVTYASRPHQNQVFFTPRESRGSTEIEVKPLTDALTAVYLPLDQSVSSATLLVGRFQVQSWTKNERGWKRAADERTDLDHLLSRERSWVADTRCLSRSRDEELGEILHKKLPPLEGDLYDRGSVVEVKGQRYQRCLAADPCLPLYGLNRESVRLIFDADDVKVFLELVQFASSCRLRDCRPPVFRTSYCNGVARTQAWSIWFASVVPWDALPLDERYSLSRLDERDRSLRSRMDRERSE